MSGRLSVKKARLLNSTGGDHFTCYWCDRKFKKSEATLEHIDETLLHKNSTSNLTLACLGCNSMRGKFQDKMGYTIQYKIRNLRIPNKMINDVLVRGWILRRNHVGLYTAILKRVCLIGKIQRNIKIVARSVFGKPSPTQPKPIKFLVNFQPIS
jgi:hypothetical protein